RVLILNEGRIAAEGSPREIATQLQGGIQIELKCKTTGAKKGALKDLLGNLPGWSGQDGEEAKKSGAGPDGAAVARFRLQAPPEVSEDQAAEAVFRAVLSLDWVILTLTPRVAGLEDLFTQLTAGG